MSAFTLEKAFDLFTGVDLPGPATRFAQAQQEFLLAAQIEELASLRFSIIITAKWEASPDESADRREELRDELEDLRTRYFDKIDSIAMTFGVDHAMKAKEQVEHGVTRPLRDELIDTANFIEMSNASARIDADFYPGAEI